MSSLNAHTRTKLNVHVLHNRSARGQVLTIKIRFMKKVAVIFKKIGDISEVSTKGDFISAVNVDVQKVNEQIDALKKAKAIKEGDALDELQKALKSVEPLSDAVVPVVVWDN